MAISSTLLAPPEAEFIPGYFDDVDTAGSFARAKAFLAGIGITVRTAQGATGFLDGILIAEGEILVDREDDALTGNVLHEAGHVATIPGRFRPLASGGLGRVGRAMRDYMDENTHLMMTWPEDPCYRACLQAADAEATAWSFAAAHASGVDTRLPFAYPECYGGAGSHIHLMISQNAYSGINGLRAAGMTNTTRLLPGAVFPEMIRWLAVD